MMALRSSEEIIGKNMKIIHENIALLDEYFADNSDLFEWVRPKAGGTGFVKFKGPISANSLADMLLDEEILIFPPYIFDCEESLSQYFRVGFSRTTMPAALKAFKAFIETKRVEWNSP